MSGDNYIMNMLDEKRVPEKKTAMFHVIKSGLVNTKSGIREVFWIDTTTLPTQQFFRSRKEAVEYIKTMYDEDYEPEEPCYDN